MREARLLTIAGMVQGVGFRWTAKRLADRLGVAGWVRNNPDGSVTLCMEGEDATLNSLVEQLDQAMGRYIVNMQSRDVETEHRDGFVIKHATPRNSSFGGSD